MGEHTKIQWADHTFNPWIGCSKVHTGCDNCYAEAQAGRFGVLWGPVGSRRMTSVSYWKKPLAWDRKAEVAGLRDRVFPSLCDPFEDWHGGFIDARNKVLHRDPNTGEYFGDDFQIGRSVVTMSEIRRNFFDLIDTAPNLDWLLLTKRPQNVQRMWPPCDPFRRRNVWLLYSASDQKTLESGLPNLLACRDLVPVLGLSLEPLIGPVNLGLLGTCPKDWGLGYSPIGDHLQWVIVGGESGPHARPCNLQWVESVVQQCREAGVPCFVKQMGSYAVTENLNAHDFAEVPAHHVWGDSCAGARFEFGHPKGGDPDEWPNGIAIRQFPNVEADE